MPAQQNGTADEVLEIEEESPRTDRKENSINQVLQAPVVNNEIELREIKKVNGE